MGKKIEIVEIQACNKLHVSFSKRRAGLFKKAKELFTLCSADVAVIVFSAAGKLYVSDNPHSTEMVIHRYLAKFGDSPPAVDEHQLLDNNRSHVGTEDKKTQLGDSMKWVNVEAIGDFQNSFIDTDRGQNFRNAEKILHRKSVF